MRILIALLAMTGSAAAHSWYDQTCCSDQDCHPIQAYEVQATPLGYKVYGTVVPYGNARISLDRDYHICVYAGQVRCFYAPPTMY
ncbi:hypothetical protein [Alsobacter sp. R-9]